MKYIAFLSMIASALAAQGFGVVTIRSGSEYQYQSLTLSGDKVIIGSSGQQIDFVLNDDTTLADSKSDKYLNIVNTEFVLSSTPQEGFAIQDEQLVYDSKDTFLVCPSDSIVGFASTCEGGLGISLRVINPTTVAECKPGHSSSTSTESTSSAVTSHSKSHHTTLTTSCTSSVSTSSKTEETSSATSSAASDIIPGKTFTLVAIHSGSEFQYVPIKNVPSHPHVFSVGGDEGSNLVVSFQDDKTSLVDLTGRGVNWDSKTGELGLVAPFGRQAATTGFSIVDGDLALDGKQEWKACPSGTDRWSLATNDCTGGTAIALKVIYA